MRIHKKIAKELNLTNNHVKLVLRGKRKAKIQDLVMINLVFTQIKIV